MKRTRERAEKAISRGNLPLKLIERVRTTSKNKFNIARAMPFFIILLLSVAMVSAGDVIAKAGNFDIDGNFTLGEKITFALGEVIDNIVDGWITITGNLNVTDNVTADYFLGDGSLLTNLPSGGNLSWNESMANDLYGYARNPFDQVLNTTSNVDFWNIISNSLVTAQITSDEIYDLSRGQFYTYTTSEADLTASNKWDNLSWDDVTAPVKQGFTHTYNDDTNDTIVVTYRGTYKIDWHINLFARSINYMKDFRILRNGVEIPGSFRQAYQYQYSGGWSNTMIAKLSPNDNLVFQWGGYNYAGTDIAIFDDANQPDPTTWVTASVSITKLSNDS